MENLVVRRRRSTVWVGALAASSLVLNQLWFYCRAVHQDRDVEKLGTENCNVVRIPTLEVDNVNPMKMVASIHESDLM